MNNTAQHSPAPDLAGRVALVTGGSSGLGLEIARTFVGLGATVVVVGRDLERGEAAAAEIGATFLQADVGRVEECKALVANTVARHGRLDVLVNNAGVFRVGATATFSEQDWGSVVGTKMAGTFFCTAAALPHLAASGSGRVINIGANSKSYPGSAAYSAANAAVSAMTRSWAVEVAGSGVTVNEIQPGFIETPATVPILGSPEHAAGVLSTIPLGRVGQPSDVARAAAYLAGEGASYVHGSSLVVDGGLALGWTR